MFYQTYTLMPPITLSPPGCDAMVPSPAALGLQCTTHVLQCIVSVGDDSAVFPALSLVTLTFETLILTFKLVQARDQTRLPCKFGANLFSHSRDI